jgi:lysophospholipase L1-like esterase
MKFVLLLLMAIPTIGHSQNQKRNYDTLPNVPDHWVKRYELFKNEPIITGKVMMVGNSITEGGNWAALLNDATVINRGISGDVTFGVLNRIKDITDRKPSRLFLLIGINDLSRNTPDDIIIQNIFKIVSKIHEDSPETKIYVQSILPLNETFKNFPRQYGFSGKMENVKRINRLVKKESQRHLFTFIDLYSKFLDKEGRMQAALSTDGLHLTQAGYSRWVEILKQKRYL